MLQCLLVQAVRVQCNDISRPGIDLLELSGATPPFLYFGSSMATRDSYV